MIQIRSSVAGLSEASNTLTITSDAADTFFFRPGMDRDVIFGFHNGADTLNVEDFGFSGFSDFSNLIRQTNGSTIITLAPGDDIVLIGITANLIDQSNFAI